MTTPNDPKLSDSRSWRAGCMAGERWRQEAASVTAERVRCSAWLGVSGRIGIGSLTKAVKAKDVRLIKLLVTRLHLVVVKRVCAIGNGKATNAVVAKESGKPKVVWWLDVTEQNANEPGRT